MLLLLACHPAPETSAVVLVFGTDGVADPSQEPIRDDTAWSVNDTGGSTSGDGSTRLDLPIGPTPLDGTWTGTFHLTDVLPLGIVDPECEGTATWTIDGDAPRHVVGTFTCADWDPQVDILPGEFDRPYGILSGVAFGTLDPADFSRFRVDMSMMADAMQPFDAEGALVRDEAGTLALHHDDVVGILGLRTGRVVDLTLMRTP